MTIREFLGTPGPLWALLGACLGGAAGILFGSIGALICKSLGWK